MSPVQPSAWWRNAAREKSQGFCSWIRNAAPETTNANGRVSSQSGLRSFPRTSPSWAMPASIIVCAHAPWASMWIAELV